MPSLVIDSRVANPKSISLRRSTLPEDAIWCDEDDHTPLVAHRPVVLVPVIVAAAGRGEGLPQEQSAAFVVDAVEGVVGAGELYRPLDPGPLPPGPDTTVARGRLRRLCSRCAALADTRATTG